VIAELRGVVADLRKQIEAQQAHIHRLVKITFGRGGERVEGPTLFDGMDPPEAGLPAPAEPPIDPRVYLTHVLTKLPVRRAGADLTDLLPDGWTRARVGARVGAG